jgi:hypothetical protein
MANSIDININFKGDNNPEKPENENQVESKPSKAQEKLDTEALKSKTESEARAKTDSKTKTQQSALDKYVSGKAANTKELLTELDSSKVKISKELRALMSKGALYVQKGVGFKGKSFQTIEENRNKPNQNKRRMNERVAKALESLLKERENALAQLAASTETVQAPTTEQVQTPVVTEQIFEDTEAGESERDKRAKAIRKGKDLANTKRLSKSVEASEKQNKEIQQFNELARQHKQSIAQEIPSQVKPLSFVPTQVNALSFLHDLIFNTEKESTSQTQQSTIEETPVVEAESPITEQAQTETLKPKSRSKKTKADLSSFPETSVANAQTKAQVKGEDYFDPKAIEKANQEASEYKSRLTVIRMQPDQFLQMAEKLGSEGAADISPEKTKTVAGVLERGEKFSSLPHLGFEIDQKTGKAKVTGHEGRHRAMALKNLGATSMPVVLRGPIRWDQQSDQKSFDRVKKWPSSLLGETEGEIPFPVSDPLKTVDAQTSASESIANALEKPEPIAKEVEQAVQPVVEAKDNLFNYTQESPGQPAEPVVATKTKDAKKKLKDAIVTNVEQAAQSAAESINKAMSGGGGKKPPKTPKAPPTGDDGEGDDGEDAYNQFMQGFISEQEYYRVLVAQVENLERSFESKLFTAKESTLPSSLQRTFEAGRRIKDFEDTQKLVDEKVASATRSAKSFRTNLENPSNTLEARIKDYIDKVSESENIDQEKLGLLRQVLRRVQTVREKTQQSYSEIAESIRTEIPESAIRGFAQGKIDRDIEELEMQQKDEDRTVKQFQREFKSFVTKKYKELANVEAFEAAKTYVETNRGKLNKRDLDAMAKIAYDKKFEEFMASASFESELSPEEIMAAYQEGQGTFKPEAFRPKNAPKNFYGKPEREPQPLNIAFDPFAGKGGKGGGGGGTNPPIGFGPDGEEIPPSRANIGLLSQNAGIDIQAIKNFKIAEASINAVGKTLVAASTKSGVRPGQIFGQASNTASTIGLAGYAAQGAASMGLASGATGAAGAVAGPVGLIVAGVTLSASYLAEIADNTSKNVEAFSPDLILSDIDNKLKNLVNNMEIANSRGASLANYQQSSNLLSRQLYNLGVDLFDQAGPLIQILVDSLSIIVMLLRMLTIFGTLIFKLMYAFVEPLAKGVQTIAKGMSTLLDWLLGRSTQLPDYEEEFMKNDPRK